MLTSGNHYRSRLTEADVREIRRWHRAGETKSSLAARYGVNPQTVCDVVRRLTWKHVPEDG